MGCIRGTEKQRKPRKRGSVLIKKIRKRISGVEKNKKTKKKRVGLD